MRILICNADTSLNDILRRLIRHLDASAVVEVTASPDHLHNADLYIPVLNNVPGLLEKLPIGGPTIALSGVPEMADKARAVGVECFPLPFDVPALVEAIGKHLRKAA